MALRLGTGGCGVCVPRERGLLTRTAVRCVKGSGHLPGCRAMSILRNSPIIILLVLYLLWRLVQWGLGL